MSHTEVPGWKRVYSGKVRDLYIPVSEEAERFVSESTGGVAPEECVLVVASDRISAYDFVLESEIPDKGKVLTAMTLWWFEQLADVEKNHLLSTRVPQVVEGRAMLCRHLHMLPIECVVRGYLTGSGLADYARNQAVCGIDLPAGLDEASRLPEPIFTPAAKAQLGEHDENISFSVVEARVGVENAQQLRDTSLTLYSRAAEIARERGIILADTKFEFGYVPSEQVGSQAAQLVLADEVLTPDSSRFWDASEWSVGSSTPSFDKQFVRDWLRSAEANWDPSLGVRPPALPDRVIEQTRERYLEAYERLTGSALEL